ncbi:hypothetical protein NC651_035294 [Populus alba x Populus x berolinensis]|nr:hypothetical protein NC651_035294 [Populus alba x Populus x berolinensis]
MGCDVCYFPFYKAEMDPVGTHSSFQVEMISPKCNVEKSRLPVGFCKSTSDCAWLSCFSFLFFRATEHRQWFRVDM